MKKISVLFLFAVIFLGKIQASERPWEDFMGISEKEEEEELSAKELVKHLEVIEREKKKEEKERIEGILKFIDEPKKQDPKELEKHYRVIEKEKRKIRQKKLEKLEKMEKQKAKRIEILRKNRRRIVKRAIRANSLLEARIKLVEIDIKNLFFIPNHTADFRFQEDIEKFFLEQIRKHYVTSGKSAEEFEREKLTAQIERGSSVYPTPKNLKEYCAQIFKPALLTIFPKQQEIKIFCYLTSDYRNPIAMIDHTKVGNRRDLIQEIKKTIKSSTGETRLCRFVKKILMLEFGHLPKKPEEGV